MRLRRTGQRLPRGTLIPAVNDGKEFSKVAEALVVWHNYDRLDGDGRIAFIVPRNGRILTIGSEWRPLMYLRLWLS